MKMMPAGPGSRRWARGKMLCLDDENKFIPMLLANGTERSV